MILAEFWVPGIPRTKGSLTSQGNGRLVDTPLSKSWRALVAERAFNDSRDRKLRRLLLNPDGTWDDVYSGFVIVEITSFTPDDVGDVDKLARNVLDAISLNCKGERDRHCAGVIRDDVQVVRLQSDRFACATGELPGQYVRVTVFGEWELQESARLARIHCRPNGSRPLERS